MPAALLDRLAPLRALLHGEHRDAVVPFVGSGLSRGLPSWDELLRKLASYAAVSERDALLEAIEAQRYLDVADLLATLPGVGPARIHEVIANCYRTERPPPDIYARLASLPTRHYATTNYDPWLKNALAARWGQVPNVLLPTDREVLAHLDEPRLWAFYLHGDADKPETCVLSARAYRELAHGVPAWKGAVEALLRGRHLLFLGTSLSEPHLLGLLDAFQQHFQPEGGRRRHWWLGVPRNGLDVHMLERRGVEVVDYQDHKLLPEILAWLATPPGVELAPPPAAVATPEPLPFDPSRPWFFVPFRPKGEGMIGREQGLARVAEALGAGRPTAIGQHAAFTGIGGIGKTQLAVEYCWEHRDHYPGGVYWFTADQDLDTQVIRLVDEARWVHPSTEPALKLQIAAHRLRSVRDALFVYDNLETAARLDTLRPEPAPGCAILLTSRLDQPDFARVEVRLLEPDQALELLRSESGRTPQGPDEEQAAQEICAHMDGLPLALELAGGYLNRRPGRSFREYADLLTRRGVAYTASTETRFGARSATRHEASLSDALRIARPLLDEHADLDAALDLLAWSGTAAMGWPLLVELVRPLDADRLRDGADLSEALRVLRREDQSPGPSSPRFRMHRLVQEVRRAERPAAEQAEEVLAALRRGAGWFEARRSEFEHLEVYEAELDHLDAWIDLADRLGDGDLRVRLRWLKAYPAWHRGRYQESLREIEAALGVFREVGLVDPVLEAHLRADRGVVLNRLGQFKQALTEGEAALQLRQATHGEDHIDTARSYDNVGGALRQLGRNTAALEYASHALSLRRRFLGEKHPDTAGSYDNVGKALGLLGRHNDALEHAFRSLHLRRELLGEKHPDTATSYNSVGHALTNVGQHEDALKLVRSASELSCELVGEKHPNTATSYNNLGTVLEQLGRREEALMQVTRALELNREVLGDDHPSTATSYYNLGHTLIALDRPRDALSHLQRALELRRDLLGERHPHTMGSCVSVLATLYELGRHDEVFALAKATLDRISPTTPQYKDIVRAYNASRPSGFRALPESPPPKAPDKKKKR